MTLRDHTIAEYLAIVDEALQIENLSRDSLVNLHVLADLREQFATAAELALRIDTALDGLRAHAAFGTTKAGRQQSAVLCQLIGSVQSEAFDIDEAIGSVPGLIVLDAALRGGGVAEFERGTFATLRQRDEARARVQLYWNTGDDAPLVLELIDAAQAQRRNTLALVKLAVSLSRMSASSGDLAGHLVAEVYLRALAASDSIEEFYTKSLVALRDYEGAKAKVQERISGLGQLFGDF